jgi:hypothetical protein
MRLAHLTAAIAAVAGLASSQPVAAQAPTAVLLSTGTNQPVAYGTVLVDAAPQGRFTDAAGRFVVATGAHRVRASNIGFWPVDTTVTVNGGSAPVAVLLRPIVVDQSATSKLGRCTTMGLSAAVEDPVLVLLRENVDRYSILLDAYPFRYKWEERRIMRSDAASREGADSRTGYTPGSDSSVGVDTTAFDSRDRAPYAVGSVVHRSAHGPVLEVPTLRDLADPAFQAAHCFAFTSAGRSELRIDFRPADSIRVPDISGSVFLDATTFVVRRAVFDLTHPQELNEAMEGVTVTAKYQEVAPLVPMLASARTEQHIRPDVAMMNSSAHQHGMQTSVVRMAHPDEEHFSIDDDRMVSHAFLGDTIGSLAASGSAGRPAETVSIAIKCNLPPSFETADVGVYATLTGAAATDASVSATLTALRSVFHLPTDLALPVYGYSVGSKVAQTLDGQVAFTVDGGHVTQVATTATSLSPGIDAALVATVQRADSAHALSRLRAGRYTLSLSSATPKANSHSLIFARIEADVLPLKRAVALDPDSTQPHLPTGGAFQFVVDESGRAMPSTLRMLTPAPDAVTAAAMQALPSLRFRPALSGECPIKQEITMTGNP